MPDLWTPWLSLDFNTRVVVAGTSLLGGSAGVVGSFTLLRKRALLGDALSHATLPGIGLAFLIGSAWGFREKSMGLLLAGALVTGLLGIAVIFAIRRWTRLRDDVAMGLVLSVFFGLGVAILGIVQQMETGHAAGLESFIYGKTATMVVRDAWRIGMISVACLVICIGLFKELRLLCFDESFAGTRGVPVLALDCVLMAMVVAITLVGLQAVGLILMIALLVIPAAAARFWTDSMPTMLVLASLGGAFSGGAGALASAQVPRLPSGPTIVLVSAAVFVVSLLAGTRRGMVRQWWSRLTTTRRIEKQHLLRAIFERLESHGGGTVPAAGERAVAIADLEPMRSWSRRSLQGIIRRCEGEGWVQHWPDESVRLTAKGFHEAARLVHEHRLLELYLISHADVAPAQVDRGADTIEHFLTPDLIARLEEQLGRSSGLALPDSPHKIST